VEPAAETPEPPPPLEDQSEGRSSDAAEPDAEPTQEESTESAETEPEATGGRPASRARSEDSEAYTATQSGSTAASVLGTATVVFGVVTAGTLGYFLDRTGQVDTCIAAEEFEDSERGCVNRPLLENQRDTGLGVFLGALGGFAILATSWAIVAATDSDDDAEEARVHCAPGLASVSCAGRF
jgi:hypothetical protein